MVMLAALTSLVPAAVGAHALVAETVSSAVAGFGLGIALASAPGPVQAVILSEAVQGGMARGFQAMAGANLIFVALLTSLALGLSMVHPGGLLLRIVKVVGGAFLLWLAANAFRSRPAVDRESAERLTLPPAGRGAIAVLVNPGVWLFLATAASSLLAAAARLGGRSSAVFAALALSTGLAIGDGTVVLIGGLGMRRAGERIGQWVRRALATTLAALGIWLLVSGVIS